MRRIPSLVCLVVAALAISPSARAVEGALGRPITGMQITPYAGVIPPEPGLLWTFGYVHYSGEIGASRQTPVGGEVALGLEAELELFTVTGVYVWDTGPSKWNFASMLTLPYINVDADAQLVLGGAGIARSDSASGPFDLYFSPVIASYHFSEVQHVSLGLYVYAPTADYEAGKLANEGLNVWTVTPSIGYTRLFQAGTLEFSLLAGLQFYDRNDDTGYKNGEVLTVDALLLKRFGNGWGVGTVGGVIEQISDDSGGPLADADGFQGQAWGLGPALTYTRKTPAGTQIDFNARYVTEFGVENRFEGDGLQLSLGVNF